MQPAATIRKWQFEQLHRATDVMKYVVQTASEADLRTYRDGGNGWTVVEVLCHLRDWEDIFAERARMTVEQENAALPNPDPDKAAAEGRYNEQTVNEALAAWNDKRHGLIAYLEGLDESAWGRIAQHPRRGPISLMDQLLLTVWHDMNHIEQITKILTAKQV